MSDVKNELSYMTMGTTDPIHVGRDTEPIIVRPGETYFIVKLKSAQAAFQGPFWESAKQLIVTSQVDLHLKNHPSLSEPVRTIQHSRKIEKGRAEKLGISPNLINLVPATMSHITIC